MIVTVTSCSFGKVASCPTGSSDSYESRVPYRGEPSLGVLLQPAGAQCICWNGCDTDLLFHKNQFEAALHGPFVVIDPHNQAGSPCVTLWVLLLFFLKNRSMCFIVFASSLHRLGQLVFNINPAVVNHWFGCAWHFGLPFSVMWSVGITLT